MAADNQAQDVYINRELSWLDFDRRVLALAKNPSVPLGEQLKFLAIYGSNLDEFFMIRVGSLYDQTLLDVPRRDNKTGWSAQEQLAHIFPAVTLLQQEADKTVKKLYRSLSDCRYEKVNFDKLDKQQEHFWKKYFLKELFPVLSPQVIDRRHPFPFLRGGETYVGARLKGKNGFFPFAIIPVSSQYDRLIFLVRDGVTHFALIEELICHFAELVFGKEEITGKTIFRVTRNADITVEEGMLDEDIDFREVMTELLKKRRKLAAVRLQVNLKTPVELTNFLCDKLMLDHSQCTYQNAPADLSFLWRLYSRLNKENIPGLFYPPHKPALPTGPYSLAKAARQEDVLIFYPYQSMKPFIQMLYEAARDPQVVSIKMTLYRVAQNSKIVEALVRAAENGKEVVTILELRARFDEQNNIDWSRQLQEAGCTVIYGFEEYKIHSKLLLITRRGAGNKFEYLSQIGTGNYNEKTAELYTDLSLVTADPEVGEDMAAVFNNLALERHTREANALMVAPLYFKSVVLECIAQEIEAVKQGGCGRILLKCNSISDKEIMEKLIEASCAGVQIDMIVRGVCCLRAGIPGKTENIRIRSIVGRDLEHARIYRFGEDEREKIYLASADFLTRNTEKRVEVGVRIKNKALRNTLRNILEMELRDNVNASEMQPDGSYRKVKASGEELRFDSQEELYHYFANAWPENGLVMQPEDPAIPQKRPVCFTRLFRRGRS